MSQRELIIGDNCNNAQYWQDIWLFKELFYYFAWRDILVRYKQTAIGVAWSVLRPLLTMIVFTFIFSKLAKLPSEGVPYPIMVFAAQLPWQLFANSLAESSNSLISNLNMITKVYFPRLVLVTSAVIVNLVDFLISLVILVFLIAWYQFIPDWRIITLPFFLLLALITSLGGGLWFGSLNVKYRDFRQVVPFVIQFGLYVSPVGFSSNIIPDKWRLVYSINPMVGVIDGFRWALGGGSVSIYWPGLVVSLIIALLILGTGFWYFRKTERTFADII